jgi:hypothetical protein
MAAAGKKDLHAKNADLQEQFETSKKEVKDAEDNYKVY